MMNAAILEKIKSLLRLGQSSNPHEAALAMRRAFELAHKHGVDVESLDLDEKLEDLVHQYRHCGSRLSYLKKRVYGILVTYFEVEVCISRPNVILVGRESAVCIANYVLEFLTRAGSAGLKAFEVQEKKARRVCNDKKRKNFVVGFIYGICSQLNEAKKSLPISDQKAALVVAEKAAREAHMKGLVGDTKSVAMDKPKRNRTALMQGYDRGRKTTINQPLGASEPEPLRLCL